MTNYLYTIKKMYPDSLFFWSGEDEEDYAGLTEWQDQENPMPTKQECDAAWNGGIDIEYQNETADEVKKSSLRKALLTKNFIVAIYKALKELKQQDLITATPEALAILEEIQEILGL